MKLVIISDIHSNVLALECVVEQVEKEFGKNIKYCILGDSIGYGYSPIDCLNQIKILVENKLVLVADGRLALLSGNHDHYWNWLETIKCQEINLHELFFVPSYHAWDRIVALSGPLSNRYNEILQTNGIGRTISTIAAQTVLLNWFEVMNENDQLAGWFTEAIQDNASEFGRPPFIYETCSNWRFCMTHASDLQNPLFNSWSVYEQRELETWKRRRERNNDKKTIYLSGHTHVAAYVTVENEIDHVIQYGHWYSIPETGAFINPGSVGIPRDYDIRPSYAIIDLDPDLSNQDSLNQKLPKVAFYRAETKNNYKDFILDELRMKRIPREVIEIFSNARLVHDITSVDNNRRDYISKLVERANGNATIKL